MNKFWRLFFLMIILIFAMTQLGIEKGDAFTLANIYETMEFACFFIFVYLMVLAKIFEQRNIIENKNI